MKILKNVVAIITIVFCAGFTSCGEDYNDEAIWEKVNDLLNRVQKLEAACDQQNANIAALQTMLNSIKDNVYIISVEEMSDGKGYRMEFSNGESINIYHGEEGGTPQISVVKEGNNYYWAVNGEILKDENGNGLVADGEGVLPTLKTGAQLEEEGVTGTWNKTSVYVSVDDVTWMEVITANSARIFTSIEISEDNQQVVITLSDGSVLYIPKTEKMLAMLYGNWKKTTEFDGCKVCLIFNEDSTCKLLFYGEEQAEDVYTGTYRFISDRYIECTMKGSLGIAEPFVLTIVEITENSLTLSGDGDCEGTYVRLTEEELEEELTTQETADVVGTWTCVEYDSNENVSETYSITFNTDGTVDFGKDIVMLDASWSYSEEGELTIAVISIATNTQTSGTNYKAAVDDIDNPTMFTGYFYNWNANQVGSSNGDSRKFTLTR